MNFFLLSINILSIEEQAQKKTNPKPVVVTKATKTKPLGKMVTKMKEILAGFADKQKKKPLRTLVVQGDQRSSPRGRMELLHFCTLRAWPVL